MDGQHASDKPAPPHATAWELDHLSGWARRYRSSREIVGTHGRVNVDRFVRRLLRLRGGILDLLPRTASGHIRTLLLDQDIDRECLPKDLADAVGFSPA
ncbi:hypothetical protein [Kibdelosporangium phytohabitans]|uniref:Uncharacterized protein n=1 Tax=Kibdelosporangium phytohabitans TaxID=860235 RepID=A0A0N9I7A0_9PSEU|nr:hypothetical protein [Kibdelosporangium phytohabitans]ALG12075.1 hypothetical protein AOZ06_39060 [Kibdelosporangium phytohabitans]MBE1463562.1 hypothetical protein [Kibdelosporangium phytohabitans]